ncbi:hypothetical protein SRHO_G00212850 [Serrasalmus rhombeus]
MQEAFVCCSLHPQLRCSAPHGEAGEEAWGAKARALQPPQKGGYADVQVICPSPAAVLQRCTDAAIFERRDIPRIERHTASSRSFRTAVSSQHR